ncbi:MAG: NUDIX domain-containing protein, partial [bacterium]
MKIPKSAKLKFKGIIFDVYQWEQKMFDGTYETFEMLKRPDTVEIIPVAGDKILINEQQQPNTPVFLSLFGGRVDEGEEPLRAAKRELLEEAGYASDDWEIIRACEPYSKMEWTV